MKSTKSEVHRKSYSIPQLRFEDQQLTSFSGLVVYQSLFQTINLKQLLRKCFNHLPVSPVFGHSSIVMILVVHVLLGYRELRHVKFYENDPIVLRTVGLSRLPDVATISRNLASVDTVSVDSVQDVMTSLVLNRLAELSLNRVTLDFDGSVLSTGRWAEGTAVGYNRKKKGQRSYYPLYCTIAQTGQVLDVLHRSGNVHDSNGAADFILQCITRVREVLPGVIIEVRMDSAFYSDAIATALDQGNIDYTISVPFERYCELKGLIEDRYWWYKLDDQLDYFESKWKPASWTNRRRFVMVRQLTPLQRKLPIQLDLFVPVDHQYEYKVILTNKSIGAGKIVAYHNGRGSQEGLFAELKSQNQMDYIPTRTWAGNKLYMMSTLLAHNLTRELQMMAYEPSRNTQSKRPALWCFEKIDTFRRRIIQRAGRLIRPNGYLTLSMTANDAVRDEMSHLLNVTNAGA